MPRSTPKQRIDLLLVERGLVASRSEAQRLIMADKVTANGASVDKPGTRVPVDAEIALVQGLRYASRDY